MPDVSHFRIFGTKVCYHVSKESRKKMEPIARKGLFVGYNETTQVYKMYIPSLKETVIMRV